jgi:hypothetical protein
LYWCALPGLGGEFGTGEQALFLVLIRSGAVIVGNIAIPILATYTR